MIPRWPTSRGAQQALLADGSPATVRLLAPDDRPALQALFDSVSEAHLYTRFFTLGRSMVTRHLDHLFADGTTVTTIVVSVGARVVGVCDVERLDPSTAEVAFLVADDLHGRGVGTLLLERAAADAHSSGIDWFVSDVLARNHEMLVVFTDVGFRVAIERNGSDVGVRMSTELDAAAVSAAGARQDAALARRAEASRQGRDPQPTAVPKSRPIA